MENTHSATGSHAGMPSGLPGPLSVALHLRIGLLIVLATATVYLPVFHFDFISFDDTIYVSENPHVNRGMTGDSIRWAFSFEEKSSTYWHPVTWLSHMLDTQLFGLDAGKHHGMNMAIHTANALLLFLALSHMTGSPLASGCAALIFAVHPINVDSVAWISERKNVLSTFFWLLVLLFHSRYARRPGWARYGLTTLFFGLGLMAKPMLVTLPFVLLLLDYWPLARYDRPTPVLSAPGGRAGAAPRLRRAAGLVLEKAPLFILSFAVVLLSTRSLERYGQMVHQTAVPMDLRLANAVTSYIGYVGKLVWPWHLSIFYPFPDHIPGWQAAGAAAVLILVTIAAALRMGRQPFWIVGWLWFAGTLVPVSGIVQAGNWPAMADRWAYVPQIGLLIALAWGMQDLAHTGKRWRRLCGIGVAVAVSASMIAAHLQVRHWENSITLYRHAVAVNPDNYLAHNNLGTALEAAGMAEAAAVHYRLALAARPDYVQALNNMGNYLADRGDTAEADALLMRALRLNPANRETIDNLGRLAAGQGDLDRAETWFRRVVALNPADARGHYNLGRNLERSGKRDAAMSHYRRAIALDNDFLEAHHNLANLYAASGRKDLAARHYREVLRIRPHDRTARILLERTGHAIIPGSAVRDAP